MEQITLYFKQGSSDKIYQAAIKPEGDGFIVTFAYGRRNSTLATGTKTQVPVPYEEAKSIFDKLVAEKTAKGYTPGADGTPYQDSADKEPTGILPMLLNPIDEAEAMRLLADTDWTMQEKFDGQRRFIRKMDGVVTGINRNGLAVALPQVLADEVARCPVDLILDGEIIGEVLHPFDVLLIGNDAIHGCRYVDRLLRLMNLLASFQHPHITFVETATTPPNKQYLWERIKTGGREGVVFKQGNAPYSVGRPASGGHALKFKFHESASFIVSGLNAKRSVSLSLRRGDSLVPAGNVTIPPNHSVPAPLAVVEVRYLYAFPESGHIYQPVYLGEREDISPTTCTVAQLKYKA